MTKDKLAPIYARITVNGQRIDQSIQRSVEVSRWGSAAGRVKGNSADAHQLNMYLDTLTGKVLRMEREMVQDGQVITFESFQENGLASPNGPGCYWKSFSNIMTNWLNW